MTENTSVPDNVSRESDVQATEHKVDELLLHAKDVKSVDSKVDDLLEYAVTTAAEGLLKNAQVAADTAAILGRMAKNMNEVRRQSWRNTVLLAIVSAGVIISAFSLVRYTVPNSNRLVECTTPSTSKHVHKCSDASTKFGFDLSRAIVKCEKNLPAVVHTDEVTACLYTELGFKPQFVIPPQK